MAYFTVCYLCRKVWCKAKSCETPKCQETCLASFLNPKGFMAKAFEYNFCGRCMLDMWEEFKKQFPRKLLPKRIRIEEPKPSFDHDDDEAET